MEERTDAVVEKEIHDDTFGDNEKEKHRVDPSVTIAWDTKGAEIGTELFDKNEGRKDLTTQAVPIRVEAGPRDMKKRQYVAARGIHVYTWKGETNEENVRCIEQIIMFPHGQPLNMTQFLLDKVDKAPTKGFKKHIHPSSI